MTATLTERAAVPFHLGLTEPIDETTTTGYPAVEGAYDPVEQIWKLPTGTPLTDPAASEKFYTATETHSIINGHLIIDDAHID